MSKQILVNASPYETRVATIEDDEIKQLHIERAEDRNVVGNIYKGVVKRVLPGMQAAFLELGLERTAFLYVDDIIDQPLGGDMDYEEIEDNGEESNDEDSEDEAPEPTPEKNADPVSEEELVDEDESEDSEWSDEDSIVEAHGGNEAPVEAEQPEPPAPRLEKAKASKPAAKNPRQKKDNRGRRNFSNKKRPRMHQNIQDLIKEGQELLVQVAKAPIGTKGARLTTHISLPGRNLVLMPTVKHIGISRRIGDDRERRRLKDIFTKKLATRSMGFIVRTVAEGRSFRDLKADADYLMKLWTRIKRDSKREKAPALIHEDLSLSLRSVRDFLNDDIDQFVIDNAVEHDKVQRFISQFMPRLKSRVKLFKGPTLMFDHYGIETEISRALGKKVWLKSGGYLLIDQSDALTAIDVNTGRYVGSKSLEETILRTNLEAVKEIAYQLRIRNVGGIIIIDLIDMESSENREKVFHTLQDALSEDKAKTNILKISELGLIEMTRKRTHEDLVRYLTESCSYCESRGYHKSRRTVAYEIFREIEKEAVNKNNNIVVFAHPKVSEYLNHTEKEHIDYLKDRLSKGIVIKSDPQFHMEQYEVFGKH